MPRALKSTIDAEMRYGLEFAEEAEAALRRRNRTRTFWASCRRPRLQRGPSRSPARRPSTVSGSPCCSGVLALYPMTGTVLNPTDWTKIEMLKDAQGRYIIGDPQGTVAPRLWGLPVVGEHRHERRHLPEPARSSTARRSSIGWQIEVMISTENVDDFEKNMISIRAEERLALVVKRPAAFITGQLPYSGAAPLVCSWLG